MQFAHLISECAFYRGVQFTRIISECALNWSVRFTRLISVCAVYRGVRTANTDDLPVKTGVKQSCILAPTIICRLPCLVIPVLKSNKDMTG